jgi:hypothetical protein
VKDKGQELLDAIDKEVEILQNESKLREYKMKDEEQKFELEMKVSIIPMYYLFVLFFSN